MKDMYAYHFVKLEYEWLIDWKTLAYRQPTFSRRSRHCRPARVLTWHFCVLHSLPDIAKLWMIYLIVLTMNGNYCVERSSLRLPHFDYKSYINTIQPCQVYENDQWWLNVLAFSTVTSFPSSKTARVLTSRISAVFSSNSSPSWVGYKITDYRGAEIE